MLNWNNNTSYKNDIKYANAKYKVKPRIDM